jgi:acetylglutamate kinase
VGAAGARLVVVKLGGATSADRDGLAAFVAEAASLVGAGVRLVLVHGGGAEVSALSRRLGLSPRFVDGVRQTTAAEMDVVDMVLCGLINKRLVRACDAAGLAAVGVCGSDGGLFVGRQQRDAGAGHTGEVERVQPQLVAALLENGYVPVIASPSHVPPQVPININADAAALELAPALAADCLLFLSDVAGVLRDGQPLAELSAESAREEIDRGTITGGMLPKIEAALGALRRGVARVVIGEYTGSGTLAAMLAGNRGTTMRLTEE